ncbi:MAG: nucleotidyl transferase AbiEii/AbiGii toxin family protein [Acidobacteriota bacterium]
MDPSELLRLVTSTLERLEFRYLVTGSTATIFFGEPRFTNDIDIVLDLPASRIAELCAAFPADDFYLSEESVRRAVARGGQFNLIHPRSGLKIDFIVATDTPFNRSRFSRSRRLTPGPDFQATFASPEDVILKKMEYFQEGHSDKHLRDIAGVFKISGDQIDRGYLEDWVAKLDLEDVWQEVLGQLDGPSNR